MILRGDTTSNEDGDQAVERASRSQRFGIYGKNVWGIRMFGTPAGADKEWAVRIQAYVELKIACMQERF